MIRSQLLVIGAGFLLAAAPVAAEDAKYVKLRQADTGKVLTVTDDSTEPGARIKVAKDDASESQQWKLEKDGDHYKLVNRKSGKVLDVSGDSKEEGAEIIQWDDKGTADGNDNQRWSWEGEGKKRRLKCKLSDLVLDTDDEGKAIQQKSDEKSKRQLWEIVEVGK